MILSKAYDEIMDRIVVNDDMRRRVLQNVEKQMVDGAGDRGKIRRKMQE